MSTFAKFPISTGFSSWKPPVASIIDLPGTGNILGDARVTQDTGTVWVWTGASWQAPMAGSVNWGTIGGILSNQTDLQLALDSKQPVGNYITGLTGDVVATGPGSVTSTIQPNVVTNAKLRQSAGLSVIGRVVATTGNVADISAPLINNRPYLRADAQLYWDNQALDFQGRDWGNLKGRTAVSASFGTRRYVRLPQHIYNDPSFVAVFKNGVQMTPGVDFTLINSESLSGKRIYVNGVQSPDPQYMIDTVELTSTYLPSDTFRVVYKEWHKAYAPRARMVLWDFSLGEKAVLPTLGFPGAATFGPVIQNRMRDIVTSSELTLTDAVQPTFDPVLEAYFQELIYSDGVDTLSIPFYLPNCLQLLDYQSNSDLTDTNSMLEIYCYQKGNTNHSPIKNMSPLAYATLITNNIADVLINSAPRNGRRNRLFKFRIRDTDTNTVTDWSELSILVKGPYRKYVNDAVVGSYFVIV